MCAEKMPLFGAEALARCTIAPVGMRPRCVGAADVGLLCTRDRCAAAFMVRARGGR